MHDRLCRLLDQARELADRTSSAMQEAYECGHEVAEALEGAPAWSTHLVLATSDAIQASNEISKALLDYAFSLSPDELDEGDEGGDDELEEGAPCGS